MQPLIQTTLIHQFRTNIAIIRSKFNQNRNKLITNLTVHLNDRCMVFYLPTVHGYIDTRNTLAYISNSLHLMCTVYLGSTTMILCTISHEMVFATSPTLYRLLASIPVLLFIFMSLSSIWCIEPLRLFNILLVICTLWPCSIFILFSFILFITSPVWLSPTSAFWLFLLML